MQSDHTDNFIMIEDFIEEIRKLEISRIQRRKKGNPKNVKNLALQPQRRFESPTETLAHIATCIEESKMSGFGSLLKGYDFQDNDTIHQTDLFTVLKNIQEL